MDIIVLLFSLFFCLVVASSLFCFPLFLHTKVCCGEAPSNTRPFALTLFLPCEQLLALTIFNFLYGTTNIALYNILLVLVTQQRPIICCILIILTILHIWYGNDHIVFTASNKLFFTCDIGTAYIVGPNDIVAFVFDMFLILWSLVDY